MKKLICCILACALALAMALTTNILASSTNFIGFTKTALTLYTASGEEVHIPAGTFAEYDTYYNFHDEAAHQQYDVFQADTGEYLRAPDSP